MSHCRAPVPLALGRHSLGRGDPGPPGEGQTAKRWKQGGWASSSGEQAIRALNSTPEGISHAGASSQKKTQRGQGHPSVLAVAPPPKEVPSAHTLPSSYFPFPPAVSMATVILLVNKKLFFLSQRSPKMRHPCLSFTQVFLPLKANHHIIQANLSAPIAEIWCHATPRSHHLCPPPASTHPDGSLSGKQEIGHFSKHSCYFFLLHCFLVEQLQ